MAQQCVATAKSTGEQCARRAIEGGTTCRVHGSGSKKAKAAAARRIAEREAQKAVALFGAPKDVDPAQALLDLVHWTAGEVEFWRERVRALAEQDEAALTWGVTKNVVGGKDSGTTSEAKPNVAYVMLYAAQDRLAQYSATALKAGVQERMVRIAEQQGAQFVGVQRAILNRMFDAMIDLLRSLGVSDARIVQALTDGWAQAMGVVVPEELMRLRESGVL